jgi:hypothetical protein
MVAEKEDHKILRCSPQCVKRACCFEEEVLYSTLDVKMSTQAPYLHFLYLFTSSSHISLGLSTFILFSGLL